MTDLKKVTPKHLLWVDLEMTGLEPTKDRITEVAAVITDWNFSELATFESGVGQDRAEVTRLYAANPWASAQPAYTQELIELSAGSPPQKQVEAKLVDLLDRHVAEGEPVLLAGNSIHTDRAFIKQCWPDLEARLHYRMLDVSAWKVVMQGKYGTEYVKKETHRALDDVRESIGELKSYLEKVRF